MALFEQAPVQPHESPFVKPWGAFKDGQLIKAWRSFPDEWDLVDLDYDFTRALSEQEAKDWSTP